MQETCRLCIEQKQAVDHASCFYSASVECRSDCVPSQPPRPGLLFGTRKFDRPNLLSRVPAQPRGICKAYTCFKESTRKYFEIINAESNVKHETFIQRQRIAPTDSIWRIICSTNLATVHLLEAQGVCHSSSTSRGGLSTLETGRAMHQSGNYSELASIEELT